MPRILVLGAGLVARPLVRYLLEQDGFELTVADQDVVRAEALLSARDNGTAVRLQADSSVGSDELSDLIERHDVVVSLLPANMHLMVATGCVAHGRHLVTASYVSPGMAQLDQQAREKKILLLNEVGLDPGLDHMSAMRVIRDIQGRGGRLTRFLSYCGGVPAPEANDNPWGYKISWSPRGVCMAANSSARYRMDGKLVEVSGAEVFDRPGVVDVDGFPHFEAYPNRDSLAYLELYGLGELETMYRGTLRYPGWCETMRAALELELFDDQPLTPADGGQGLTFASYMARHAGAGDVVSAAESRRVVAQRLGLGSDSPVLERLAWLGLFDEVPVPGLGEQVKSSLDIVARAMAERLAYAPGECDAIALTHFFTARFEDAGTVEQVRSTLTMRGQPDGDSAMALTVGLPAAVATRLLASGELDWPGVHIPVVAEIYEPILSELEGQGIRFVETTESRPA